MMDNQHWARVVRTLDAPIATVWEMWTDPDRFRSWYGPMGMTVPVAEMDLRVGGVRKIAMEMVRPDRVMRMWFTGIYKEITPVTRLVYTEAMCDENGVLIPPAQMGMPEGTPDITEVIVTLQDMGDKTAMTLVHVGVPAGSPGEGGWGQAIDKLAAMLAAG